MRASFLLPLSLGIAGSFAACGGVDATSTSTSTGGGATTTTGSGGAGGAMPAPFGLDQRPVNATCKVPPRPPITSPPVRFEKAFGEVAFSAPMGVTQIPGDPSRFFVFLRSGVVMSFPVADPTQVTTVLTVPQPVQTLGEGGLLGLAFHPKFLENGQVFFSYTTTGGPAKLRSVVARMTSNDGGKSFGGYTEILGPFNQPFSNHNGGDAHFGKDGYLYLSFGDGGSGGDPLGYGQNKDTFFSKILRIDVDGASPYAIPEGNPFKNGGGEPATFAYGFRNPFRFSVDRSTGDLWVGDVGQNAYEEIDAKIVAGGNYGWNTREGFHCFNPMNGCPSAGFINPVFEYDHTVGKSITGGVVYRGKAIPTFQGTYIFADFVSQAIYGLTFSPGDGTPLVTTLNPSGPNGSWVGFGEDNDGEVYAVDVNGTIYKLKPDDSQPPPPQPFPATLSKTGCVDPSDPTKPAAGLIPYEPHSPLWSDGADKERWLALPEGETITIQADGDFDFPIGSVLLKSFRVDGLLVETRLFVRHDDGGWAGYTYAWDDAQKDATLLPSSLVKPLASGKSWYYPSRAECLSCHTGAAGRTLGLEIGQLNADFTYASTGRISNQLATFEHIGLLSAPLSGPVDTLTAFPRPTSDEGTAEDRARSYLHANCSFCHRPNSNGGGPMDLRFSLPLSVAQVCGVDPSNGDLGIAGAKILAPGDAARSLISARPKALGVGRMPPLASQVVDVEGIAAIDAWITGLASCPSP